MGAFLGTFLLSLLVALIAGLQLADHFRATEEFIVVLFALPVFAIVSIVAFGIACAAAKSVRTFHWVAAGLFMMALVLVALPGLSDWWRGRTTRFFGIGPQDIPIVLELLVPTALMILIQWGLLRRRWLRARGEEDLTTWPWITTAVAGLAILNPGGLAVVSAALQQSPTDWLRDLWLWVAVAGAATVIVMAGIEYYIRRRMLRRRLAQNLPTAGGVGG